jgi:hypothetical protein
VVKYLFYNILDVYIENNIFENYYFFLDRQLLLN